MVFQDLTCVEVVCGFTLVFVVRVVYGCEFADQRFVPFALTANRVGMSGSAAVLEQPALHHWT